MYKLIIVEDDMNIRNGLSGFFPWNDIGFELVKSFENGQDALDYLTGPAAQAIDVVMTDIKMPVLDGHAFTRRLKELEHPAMVVFLTAYRNFDYAQQAIGLGVKNYIVKSTKYDELVAVFRDIRLQLDQGAQLPPGALEQQPAIPADSRSQMEQILEYIDGDIKNATLQTVARRFSLNPVYFSRYFKKACGINFIDYILRKKMELAAEYLCRQGLLVAEVSGRLGYSSEKNFSRAFKKFYGVSPSSYRRFATRQGEPA